ncbi:hypothetical protein QQ045_023528 [Rhodiola kirilowii]
MVSLLIQITAGVSMIFMTFLETRVYVCDFQLLARFGIAYVLDLLVGDAVMINLLLPLKFHDRLVITSVVINMMKVLFGALHLFRIPNLSSYSRSTVPQTEYCDSYEALPGEEEVCPKLLTLLESSLWTDWLEKHWSKGKHWWEEVKANSSWVLKRLMQCKEIGLRCVSITNNIASWRGIGEGFGVKDTYNMLTERNEPVDWFKLVWNAFNAMRDSLNAWLAIQNKLLTRDRLCHLGVAALFRKSLRLSHEAQKNFPSGRIMNMISTDANTLPRTSTHQASNTYGFEGHNTSTRDGQYLRDGGTTRPRQGGTKNTSTREEQHGHARRDEKNPSTIVEGKCHGGVRTLNLAFARQVLYQLHHHLIDTFSLLLFCFRNSFGVLLINYLNSFLLQSVPVCVTVVSFGMFTMRGGDLTPARAFTSLSLFAMLHFPLCSLPNAIVQIVNACISLCRIEEFLSSDERSLVENLPVEQRKPTLRNINVDIPVGSLVAIVCGTGEGKTSLISAMLGELPSLTGACVAIRGSVAYVPQISWIFNATVQENILFGSKFEEARYWKAIDVTELQADLELLPVKLTGYSYSF